MKVHHIGYLVKDIEKSVIDFKALGYKIEKSIHFDELRQIKVCFMISDGYRVELVEPNKNSKIYPLLKKYKNSPYHMCYECDDIEKVIFEYEVQGFKMFLPPEEASAIEHRKVAFFMTPATGIIELVEGID